MFIHSSALLLTFLTAAAIPSQPDLAPGVQLVRLVNTIESREKSGYRSTDELQNSAALDNLATAPGLSETLKNLNRKDLANPFPGWTLRIYTSADRRHYLVRAENSTGAAVYSDERGLINTSSPVK